MVTYEDASRATDELVRMIQVRIASLSNSLYRTKASMYLQFNFAATIDFPNYILIFSFLYAGACWLICKSLRLFYNGCFRGNYNSGLE